MGPPFLAGGGPVQECQASYADTRRGSRFSEVSADRDVVVKDERRHADNKSKYVSEKGIDDFHDGDVIGRLHGRGNRITKQFDSVKDFQDTEYQWIYSQRKAKAADEKRADSKNGDGEK